MIDLSLSSYFVLKGPKMKNRLFKDITDTKKPTSIFHDRNIVDYNIRIELTAKWDVKYYFLLILW